MNGRTQIRTEQVPAPAPALAPTPDRMAEQFARFNGYGCVLGCLLHGIEGRPVQIEVTLTAGLPAFDLIGMPGQSVREAQNRIRSALTRMGLTLPQGRMTVSLQPGWLPKSGSGFDLPMALAMIRASRSETGARPLAALGELSLVGAVLPVRGVVPLVAEMLNSASAWVLVPADNLNELACFSDTRLVGVRHLREAVRYLDDAAPAKSGREKQLSAPDAAPCAPASDMASRTSHAPVSEAPASTAVLPGCLGPIGELMDLPGQRPAVRALLAACAGGHPLLMLGSPGCGKTTLARLAGALLPPMDPKTRMAVLQIYSAAGLLADGLPPRFGRPVRAPHFGISVPNLIGGGRYPLPGEVSLAHGGVLFIDEINEMAPAALAALRAPLDDHCVCVIRRTGRFVFPSDFLLIAAANPCPCGRLLEDQSEQPCRCQPGEIARYERRLAGAFGDRLDIRIDLRRMDTDSLSRSLNRQTAVDLSKARTRLADARRMQLDRNGVDAHGRVRLNGRLGGAELGDRLRLTPPARQLALRYAERLKLSVRAFHKLMKVARTLADLDGDAALDTRHLAEAMQYGKR